MSPPTDYERRFTGFLAELARREDRAALAALRRGLGRAPAEAAEAHRYVVPWLPSDASHRRESAYYQVAALFAWHQGSWHPTEDSGPTNLGASMRRLAHRRATESVERRFVALLNSHPDDLGRNLRQAIGLLKADDVPVDWAQLLHDVQDWDRPGRWVQLTWARTFWGRSDGTGADAAQAAEEPSQNE